MEFSPITVAVCCVIFSGVVTALVHYIRRYRGALKQVETYRGILDLIMERHPDMFPHFSDDSPGGDGAE